MESKMRAKVLISLLLVITVTLIGLIISRRLPLLDVDLLVPLTFRPFANRGTRVGIHSEWSLNVLHLQNHLAHTFDTHIHIDRIEEWADILPLDKVAPSSAEIIQLIRSNIGLVRSTLTFSFYVFAAAALAMLGGITLPSRTDHRYPQVSEMLIVPLVDPHVTENRLIVQVETRKIRIGDACCRLSVLLVLLATTVLVIVVTTHYDDIAGNVKRLLPLLVSRLSLICVTHSANECQIQFAPRAPVYALSGAIAALFVSAILGLSYNTV